MFFAHGVVPRARSLLPDGHDAPRAGAGGWRRRWGSGRWVGRPYDLVLGAAAPRSTRIASCVTSIWSARRGATSRAPRDGGPRPPRGVRRAASTRRSGVLRRRRPLEHALLRLPLEPWTVDRLRDPAPRAWRSASRFKWRTAPGVPGDRRPAREPTARSSLDGILPPGPQPGEEALAQVVVAGLEGALAFLPSGPRSQGSNAFVVGGGRARRAGSRSSRATRTSSSRCRRSGTSRRSAADATGRSAARSRACRAS